MKSSSDRIDQKRAKMVRDWLALLPWDIIYALGAVVLIALITLLSFLIAKVS